MSKEISVIVTTLHVRTETLIAHDFAKDLYLTKGMKDAEETSSKSRKPFYW
jgi:hypothetical protein